MQYLAVDDMEDLALGAAVLGTGGGGDPYLGKLMAKRALERYGPVRLLDVEAIDDHAFVATTSMMGAPTVMQEKVPSGDECDEALRRLEIHLGKTAQALVPGECGGLNSTIPVAVAARRGLPLLDGDGMGRAFPEMQQDTYNLFGVLASPCVLLNERGDVCIVETTDNNKLEWIARGITMRFGGVAHIATHPMSGRQAKQSCVRGSVSLALGIGRTLHAARGAKQDPFAALRSFTEARGAASRTLFRGKIMSVQRRTEGGFTRGTLEIEGADDCHGETMSLDFQNENLVAARQGRVVATVPDLITIFDTEAAVPITTEAVRYGMRVRVIGLPCAPIMRCERGLALWGPRAFGYDIDYRAIEDIGREGEA